MTSILHAEIECEDGVRVVADGSGKRLTEQEAKEILRALLERQRGCLKHVRPRRAKSR